MKIKVQLMLLISLYFILSSSERIDLTLIGNCDDGGSIPKISLSLIDILKNNLTLSFLPTQIISDSNTCNQMLAKKNNTANVSLLIDMLTRENKKFFKLVPDSKIKISYSMLESTRIPNEWVKALNNNFDLVVVPDKFLINVYKSSGIKIPIFVLPVIIHIDELLNKPGKSKSNTPFVFGCSTVNYPRKNIELLINSFSKAFKNNKDVLLKIHTKSNLYINDLEKIVLDTNITNIEIIQKKLSWNDYLNFISSLDCYILLSKGEGFSITPREALAAGIPCILSNNTSHKTICETSFVYGVPSNISENAYYPVFKEYCGKHFNCKINDVIKAFHQVYNNYDIYLKKAQKGRIWVQQYTGNNLKLKYLNLIKPKKILLGKENKVTDEYLMTSSVTLFNKYKKLIT